jgi:hypothetical protein
MIYVTSIYDDAGRKVGEVSKCDHKPRWLWYEIVAGIITALLAISQWAVA